MIDNNYPPNFTVAEFEFENGERNSVEVEEQSYEDEGEYE